MGAWLATTIGTGLVKGYQSIQNKKKQNALLQARLESDIKSGMDKKEAYRKFFADTYSVTGSDVYKKQAEMLGGLVRTPGGAAGDAALRKMSQANKEMINSQLSNTTELINREWANAGRFTSGRRTADIMSAAEQAQTAVARANAANALDLFKFNTATEEERARFQAELDSRKTSKADILGDILGIGVQAYITNPEQTKSDLGWLGEKLGIGGGGGVAPTGDATSEAMSLFGETAGSSDMFAPQETEPILAPPRQPSIFETLLPSMKKTATAAGNYKPPIPFSNTTVTIDDYRGKTADDIRNSLVTNDDFVNEVSDSLYNSLPNIDINDMAELHKKLMAPNVDVPKILAEWFNTR